jgi:hypothetical protein
LSEGYGFYIVVGQAFHAIKREMQMRGTERKAAGQTGRYERI